MSLILASSIKLVCIEIDPLSVFFYLNVVCSKSGLRFIKISGLLETLKTFKYVHRYEFYFYFTKHAIGKCNG